MIRLARNLIEGGIRLQSRLSRGLSPAVMTFSGDRAADLSILDFNQLPVQINTSELVKSSTGDFYFIEGYSALDGPDVIL